LFNTAHDCQLVDGKIVDGVAHVGNKDFIVDTTEPLILRKKNPKILQLLGDKYKFFPLYFVKWDNNEPITLKNIQNIEEIDIKQDTLKPELVRKLAETRVLQGLFHQGDSGIFSGKSKSTIMYVIVVLIGIFLYLYMFTDVI